MNWQLLKHPLRQPFVASLGLFAGVHTTWTIGTFFSGEMPNPDGQGWQFAFWIIPALFFAFSIDIGQIVTAAEIRNGDRSKYKYATFILLALTTFYLQFLYMAHHMPALQISDGVVLGLGQVTLLRNAAIWILPALLPMSTIFYTLGSNTPETTVREQIADLAPMQQERETPLIHIACPDCDFAGDYETERAATNALNAHKKHCLPLMVVSRNGRHLEE